MPQLLGPLSVFSLVVATCVELAKIGVAGDAEKRLRELQVGSPVQRGAKSSSLPLALLPGPEPGQSSDGSFSSVRPTTSS